MTKHLDYIHDEICVFIRVKLENSAKHLIRIKSMLYSLFIVLKKNKIYIFWITFSMLIYNHIIVSRVLDTCYTYCNTIFIITFKLLRLTYLK